MMGHDSIEYQFRFTIFLSNFHADLNVGTFHLVIDSFTNIMQ